MGNVDLSIDGGVLVWMMLGIAVFIAGLILVMRNTYSKRSQSDLADQETGNSSPLKGRNKYTSVDVFCLSGTFFNLGLALSVGLAVLAFSWTQFEEVIDVSEYLEDLEEDI